MTETLQQDRLIDAEWILEHRQSRHATEAGQAHTIIKGEPYWRVVLRYVFLKQHRSEFLAQSAQFQRLNGGQVPIELFRPQRKQPAGFDASGAAGVVSALSTNTTTRELDLTCGGELNLGDMVAYDTDANGNRFVGEIVEVVSRPGANQAIVKTQPRVRGAHTTPAASIYAAAGIFRLDQGSLRISDTLGSGRPSTIEASFTQVTP